MTIGKGLFLLEDDLIEVLLYIGKEKREVPQYLKSIGCLLLFDRE